MEEKDKDLRGLDLRAEHFYTQLISLVNNSGLRVSTTLFILKSILYELQNAYDKVVEQQYQDFCSAATDEKQKEENEEKIEEDSKE